MQKIIFIALLLGVLLVCGCSSDSKLARHIQRADAFYEKGEHEKARIEYLNAFQLDQSNPHVASRLAEAFLKDGEVMQAFRLYDRALSLQPTNNDSRIKLASILLLGGKAAEAREHASEVLKNAPLDPDALLLYANASIRTNELAEARTRFESLAAANPNVAAVHLANATIAQRLQLWDKAASDFKRAVELEPKSARNNLALGSFYFLRGDTNNAGVHLKAAMELSPAKSVERLGYAEFLLKTGQSKAAESLLIEATTAHPDFTSAWNMLTQLAFAQNDTNKAATLISSALAKSPNDRDARLNQARLKLASRDYKTVLADLQHLATEQPRDPQIQFQLAIAHLANEDQNQAFAAVDRAINLNPNNLDALLLRARLLVARGDWNNALPELNDLTRRFPSASQPYFLLASAHRARGATNEAAAVYTTITKAFPKDPLGFQLLGVSLRQHNKPSPARQAFEEALRIAPDYLAAIESLTDLDIEAKQFDAALKRVNFYVEKYPKSPLPPLLLGKIYFQQQKVGEAEAAIQKAIALEPEFMPGHRTLANLYVQTKETDKAIAKYEAIVAKDSKDIASRIQLGMLYDATSKFDRALEHYEAVLKLNPNSLVALNNIAYLLSERLNQVDRALQYARRARDLNPQEPAAADTFGWILWKKGQYPEALAALQQSADRLPDQPEVQYHLGMAQYMIGDIQSATASLTKATQSTNDFIGKNLAADALALLRINPAKGTQQDIESIQRHVSNNPKDIFAHVQLARLFEAKADWNKAREAYEKALSINPRSLIALSGLANLYATSLNQPDRALEYSRQAWNVAPNASTAATVGPTAYHAGDFKWANGRLIEAVRTQPSPTLLYYKALASYALGSLPQARDEFSRLVNQSQGLDPSTLELAKSALVLIKFQIGEAPLADAERALKTARDLNPQFLPALVAEGVIAEQKNDFTTARSAYETVLKSRPHALVAQRQLAILLADKLPDDNRAQQLATSLRQDFPDDPALSKILGKVAYRRGEHREAARLLSSAAARLPKDADLLFHLGMAQYHAKEKAAKDSLNKAIALAPNAPFVADARKTIAELN